LAPKPASGSGPFLPVAPAATDVNYVALGDSYSAGHGVMPYDPGTNDRRDKCHRSKYAYSRQLELPHVRLVRSFFACAGATTENVVSQTTAHVHSVLQWPGEHVVQLANTKQLSAADLVTITIGGNDVRFDRVLMACIRPANCNKYRVADNAPVTGRAGILANTSALYPKLVETFTQLRAAVPPTAAVLALDYPQLFPAAGLPASCPPDAGLFTKDVQHFLRHAADLLDETEQSAARAAGLQFVDVRPIFDGHEICGRRGGWITHLLIRPVPGGPPVGEASVHPNRAGQAAYARAIRDYTDAHSGAHTQLTPKGLPANPTPQP
jgi:lysophospholipase L1-like esterase